MATVLLIESDVGLAQSVREALSVRGVESEWTADGFDGIDIARRVRPAAIVLCVELTRMSGYSVCNKLRKDAELSKTPLVLTSAQATVETFEQHSKLRTRADAYLKKPYTVDALIAVLGGFAPLCTLAASPAASPAAAPVAAPVSQEKESTGAQAQAQQEARADEGLLADAHAARAALADELRAMAADKAGLADTLSALSADKTALTERLRIADDEKAGLSAQLEAAKQEAAQLRRALADAQRMCERAREAIDVALELVSERSPSCAGDACPGYA